MPVPLRVLIVEDNPDDAELVELALSRSGFDPVLKRVESAAEMRTALNEGRWDVVLSDHSMPGFGSAAALVLCKEADPDLPFVVVSGTIGEEQAVEMMRLGASDYLLKGNLGRLVPTVERELRETESRRARRKLEQEVVRLAAIVESSEDAILSRTLDGIITAWNPAAERLFGWSAGEVIGTHSSLYVPPELSGELSDHLEQARRGQGVKSFETVRLRNDGTPVNVAITISPIHDRAGIVVGSSAIIRDITEKKQAEQALRASEVRYRRLFEAAKDGILILDYDTARINDANRFICELLGYSHADLLGKELWEIGLFQNVEASKAAVHELQERAYVRYEDLPLLTRDGRKVEVEFVSNVYAVGDARVIQCNIRDITERKRADEALRTSEVRYRTLVAATAAIVWDSPPSGEFDSEQPGWSAFTGQTLEQHRGWGWLNAIHPDDREHSGRAWAGAVTSRTVYHVEHRVRRADGEYRHMSARAVPVLDPGGAIREWVGVHTDVSDFRRADAERADLLARLQLNIERMPLAYVLFDPALRVIEWNPAAERIFGYAKHEAIGLTPFDLVAPAARKVADELLGRIRSGDMAAHSVNENRTKDGRTITCEWHNTPLLEGAGHFSGLLSLAQDISEQRSLEDQYRQAQKMEAVGQLAGGIAHDFNNLLCIINGYSDLLLQGLPPDHPSYPFLAEIRSAGERSASLTRQLLVFSRKQVVAPTVLDLNAVITDAEKLLRRVIGENVRMASSLGGGLGRVRADAGQIEQLLMNLVINARDAMPEGGRLTVETRNVDLDEEYGRVHAGVRPGPHVLLAVSDTGCGMTAEVKARIFDPFFTTKEAGKGTGLGLAVVHGVVKQAGGSVEVYSEVGKGTTFKVYLPRVDQQAQPGKSRSGIHPPPRGTETVLVVEDEDGVRALTCHVLAGCGYKVLEAADGEQGPLVAGRHGGPIDLLVTDVVMPGLSGRQVAERLLALHPGLEVLYVSGYADDAVVRHGVLEDQAHFLQKPFSLLALAMKVREVLDQRRGEPA